MQKGSSGQSIEQGSLSRTSKFVPRARRARSARDSFHSLSVIRYLRAMQKGSSGQSIEQGSMARTSKFVPRARRAKSASDSFHALPVVRSWNLGAMHEGPIPRDQEAQQGIE
eukprot:1161856-Pelagomonas_calceolata.AAC.1